MPHDRDGKELKIGDKVNVECRVKEIHVTATLCNLTLETTEFMPTYHGGTHIVLNTKQVTKKC